MRQGKRYYTFWAKAGGADEQFLSSWHLMSLFYVEKENMSVWDILPAYAVLCLSFLLYSYGYQIAVCTKNCKAYT